MIIIIFIIIIILLSILFIIYNNLKYNKQYNKYAIHTVFILKENILFLEEWLKYHIHIGFNKFYLYDNTGSMGFNNNYDNIDLNKKNKYNIQYDKYINEEQTKIKFKDILNKYNNYITYIKWQPKNEKGEIMYGQEKSINNYVKKYKNENDWTAFIDMDEFIYMKNHDSIQDFINNHKQYNKIKMNMKNFDDRFLHVNKSIFEINNSIKHDDIFLNWACKHICLNSDLTTDTQTIHDISVKNEKIYDSKNIEDIRYNHYNVNYNKLNWMKDYFGRNNFEREQDNCMKKYINI